MTPTHISIAVLEISQGLSEAIPPEILTNTQIIMNGRDNACMHNQIPLASLRDEIS